jgi:hypothetical protein
MQIYQWIPRRLGAAAWQADNSLDAGSPMQWQYLIERLDNLSPSELKEKLDEKGRDGWELAAVIDEDSQKCGIFKRATEPIARVR